MGGRETTILFGMVAIAALGTVMTVYAQDTISGLEVTGTSDGATMSWDRYDRMENYVVRVDDTHGQRVMVTHTSGISYTITGLASDTSYQVSVRLKGDSSVKSDTITFTTLSDTSSKINDDDNTSAKITLYSPEVTSDGASISWDRYDRMDRYVIRVLDSNGDRVQVKQATGTSYIITGLESNTSYQVSVRLKGDTSVQSDTTTFTTLGTGTGKIALNTIRSTSDGASISWDRYDRMDRYVIRVLDSNGDRVQVKQATGTSYIITGLESNTSYQVSVRLKGDTSVQSDTTTFTTLGTGTGKIALNTIRSTSDGASISWDRYDRMDRYVIRVLDSNGDRVQVKQATGTSYIITGLESNTSYQVSVRLKGDTSVQSDTTTFRTTKSVGAPKFTSSIGNITMEEAQVRIITLNATDPNGDSLVYRITNQDDSPTPVVFYIDDDKLYLVATRHESGTYKLRVTVSDGTNIDKDDFVLTINDGAIPPPSITRITDTTITIQLPSEDDDPRCVAAYAISYIPPKFAVGVQTESGEPITITDLTPSTVYDVTVYNRCHSYYLSHFTFTTTDNPS